MKRPAPFSSIAFPLIRQTFPKISAKFLKDDPKLDKPSSLIFYLDYQWDVDRAKDYKEQYALVVGKESADKLLKDYISASYAQQTAIIRNTKLALEEAFRPHLAKLFADNDFIRSLKPYRLTVGKNIIAAFYCKHGNIVLESDDCPQCVNESIF